MIDQSRDYVTRTEHLKLVGELESDIRKLLDWNHRIIDALFDEGDVGRRAASMAHSAIMQYSNAHHERTK